MELAQGEAKHCEIDSDRTNEMTHDSLVTVRLSEPQLTIDTKTGEEIPDEIDRFEETAADAELNDANESPAIAMRDPSGNETESARSQGAELRRGSDSSEGSGQVNWEELEKTEEQEPRDQESDDVRAFHSATKSC